MSLPEREEFPALVMQMVKAKFPLVKIAPAREGFAVTVNGNLASLENLYRMASLRPDDVNQHVNRWVVELLRAAEGTNDQEGTYEELKARILPLVLSSEASHSRGRDSTEVISRLSDGACPLRAASKSAELMTCRRPLGTGRVDR